MSALTYRPSPLGFETGPSPAVSPVAGLFEEFCKMFEAQRSPESERSETLRELEDTFLDCRRENWDGYDALAVKNGAFIEANSFLRTALKRFPAPTASATPSGSLTLEWIVSPSRRFIVIFGGDTQIAYAGIYGSETIQGTAIFVRDLPLEVAKQLVRLFYLS
jgi:hypothetical protein